jgi:hypothetical protein
VDLPVPGFVVSACVYASADGTLTFALGPRGLARNDFESVMRLVPNATSLTGIGDSAFSLKVDVASGMAGAAGIVALKGGNYFTVQAASRSKTSEQLSSALQDLAKKAASKL